MEFITNLEEKIDSLISTHQALQADKDNLDNELQEKNEQINQLQNENDQLKNKIEDLQSISTDKQGAIDSAAEQVQKLIAKLEAVS